MTKHLASLGILLAIVLAASTVRADSYKIDPVHSTMIFRVIHMNIAPVYGRFDEPSGTIVTDDDPAKMSIEVNVRAEKVDTANSKRDQDLRSQGWLAAKQFPDITFKSTGIKKTGDNTYEVTGDFTLHGVTKPLTATLTKTGEGKGMRGEPRIGWETSFSINRNDFDITNMPGGVSDEIKLMIGLEAIKQ
jgi:polyisoprenoid-binding protein YceI